MGVGMPESLYLNEFGSYLMDAFDGEIAYHVGSSLREKSGWRDVDVRLILTDEKYAEMGFGDPLEAQQNAKWVALVMAFSALGREMTGLPIDFQIQQMSQANKEYRDVTDVKVEVVYGIGITSNDSVQSKRDMLKRQHPRSALGFCVPWRWDKMKSNSG